MIYTRGSKDDFDNYAALTGDEGWSWNALQPYFKKVRVVQHSPASYTTNAVY